MLLHDALNLFTNNDAKTEKTNPLASLHLALSYV